jgi:exopolysaccharide biosynthesis protein
MQRETKNLIKVFVGLFVGIICSGLFSIWLVFYGPLTPVKELFVTTAMTTFSHQYIARLFVSNEEIERIMAKNSIGDIQGETDTSKIMALGELDMLRLEKLESIKRRYNAEEKQDSVPKPDTRQAEIELKNINGKAFKGWMLIIKDPSRVMLGTTENLGKRGMKLDQIIKKYDAIAGINAGGFADDEGHGTGGTPMGIIIENYKVLYKDNGVKFSIIAFDKQNRLILGNYTIDDMKKKEIRDAVSFRPFLILNGKASIKSGNGGWGIAPRTAIGQRADGTILMLAIDGRQATSIGATMKDVQDIMVEYGAVNAANLDGGSSTTMYHNGKIVNRPSSSAGPRYLPSAFLVK